MFAALEMVWGVSIYRQALCLAWAGTRVSGSSLGLHSSAGVAFGALEGSSEGLALCEDVKLSLGRILAYDCL